LAVGAPVDVADLIAGIILAMLGELDGEALVRTLVDAGEEALDQLPGDHRQAAVLGQRCRIEVNRGGWHGGPQEEQPRINRISRIKKEKQMQSKDGFPTVREHAFF